MIKILNIYFCRQRCVLRMCANKNKKVKAKSSILENPYEPDQTNRQPNQNEIVEQVQVEDGSSNSAVDIAINIEVDSSLSDHIDSPSSGSDETQTDTDSTIESSESSASSSVEKLYKCTECNKSFAKQRYAKALCSKKLPWKCETCFEIIKHSQNIPRHLRRCAEATKPKPKSSLRVFTCEECPKKFSFKCNLERHMTTCHDFSKIASYPCFAYNCSFKTNSIAQLKRNNSNKHMVKDKIPCQMCTLSFMSYSGLEKHMLCTHRIECNYCTETFSSEKLLRLHRYR